ncbi:MAG TPA: gephyrin-like molybdotransferase Glp [Terriglobales bacterium]
MTSTPHPPGVLSFENARRCVLDYCRQIAPPLTEDVSLLAAFGRVLAEPVHADRPFPPFARSTRDGYAVRSADLTTASCTLLVVGQIKAGDGFDHALAAGEAVEIMTGAAVPEGADTVVMVEHTSQRETAGRKEVDVQRAGGQGENIVPAGAEARQGQEILPRGMRLDSAQIAMAAGAGRSKLTVYRRPQVAILATGDELVDLARIPGPFQIRNSNSYSLATQILARGGDPFRLPVAPDEPRKLSTLIHAGLSADLLLISGGVSMGKFDLVEAALRKMGAEFFFTGVLIQPGRPVVFGHVEFSGGRRRSGIRREARKVRSLRRIPFFGLPGNPISAMVCFELFGHAVLDALGGAVPSRLPAAKARLRQAVRTKTGLTRFLPAVLEGGLDDPQVEAISWQGSGDLLASARANCYLVVPPDRDSIAAGETVSILTR